MELKNKVSIMKTVLVFFLLAVSLTVSAQNIEKKCKSCGKLISQCQFKGRHTKHHNNHRYKVETEDRMPSKTNPEDSIRRERLKNATDVSSWGYDPAFLEYKDENDKYGYINRTGDIVIPCQWKYVHGFRDGLAIVVNEEEKKGYIDTKGNIVSPCQWEDIVIFREGMSPVKDGNGKWGAIDKEGKLVIPCIWNGMTSFGDGMTCVSKEISIDVYEERSSMFNGGRWVKKTEIRHGYIDKTGKEVLPFVWKSAMMFSEGLGAVKDDNGKWGFIDKKGQVVIPCQWKDTYTFTNGTASVKDENDVWHKIDKTGKIVKQ